MKAILLKMWRIRCQIKMLQTKNYVDKNAIATDISVVYGDTNFSVGSDLVRSPGCIDLTAGKKFTLLLESDTNICYRIPYRIHDYH